MKKWALLFVIILLSLSLSACNFSEHGELYDNEEKMMAVGDTYSFLGMVETNENIEFQRFSGIYTLSTINISGAIIIDLSIDITRGRFKVILVFDQDEILELEEGINSLNLMDREARLRIVGDDAKGSLSFSIESTTTL